MSPYGETKVVGEWLGRATAAMSELRAISLRYFNVAGAATPELGDPAVFNLIPMALRALTSGEAPKIFGDDYPTPDGTCIRDYVHVADVADAHVCALEHLDKGGGSATYNIGRGVGSSVREVLAMVAEVTGMMAEPAVMPRRDGDPARIVATVDRIKAELEWTARYDLRAMVESAWEAWKVSPPAS
jgi:UDP-glucose 4-epimerase